MWGSEKKNTKQKTGFQSEKHEIGPKFYFF